MSNEIKNKNIQEKINLCEDQNIDNIKNNLSKYNTKIKKEEEDEFEKKAKKYYYELIDNLYNLNHLDI